ncbi:hypothetical protein BDN72DRAFT_860628 [Pluteus cervinus]|uniref:Uncharacterized protein n=1 Tax=Pluteus cervinus TaxID=181527 RepID=A0ACD3AI30_9AGAR|nr:hypothetical protein BDN72DRAFT_860628 [Pluteus cervinus]
MSTNSEILFATKVELTALTKDLPHRIALTRTDDQILQLFKSVPVPTDPAEMWTVFGDQMDIPFRNDEKDLVEYLNNVAMGQGLLWDLAPLKVECLIEGLQVLGCHKNESTVTTEEYMKHKVYLIKIQIGWVLKNSDQMLANWPPSTECETLWIGLVHRVEQDDFFEALRFELGNKMLVWKALQIVKGSTGR